MFKQIEFQTKWIVEHSLNTLASWFLKLRFFQIPDNMSQTLNC